jgi:Protein of unknown function (DUF1573)
MRYCTARGMRRYVLLGVMVFGAGVGAWFGAKLWARHSDAGAGRRGLVAIDGASVELRHNSRTEPIEHEFRLLNPTSAPIEILDVETGCACVTTSTSAGTVGPGEVFPLRIKLTAFPMDFAEERRVVRVTTSDPEPLVLELRVRLPLPEQVLYRPEALYFYPLPGEERVSRSVGLRVPKHHGRTLTREDVVKVACDRVAVELTELPASDMYFEYRLTAAMDASDVLPASACVRVNTGRDPLTIPLLCHKAP